jgi:hypothetical protein
MRFSKRASVLTLAAVFALFSAGGCSRSSKPADPPVNPPAATEVQHPPTPPVAQEPEPEVAIEEEQTAPPVDFTLANNYAEALRATLQKAGYQGRETIDPNAEIERQSKIEDDEADDLPDPAAIAKTPFDPAAKNIFTWTNAPFKAELDEEGTHWVQQITVLGNIRVTLPAATVDGEKVAEARYGNVLTINVGVPADAENPDEIVIRVSRFFGYTDGKTIWTGGFGDLSSREYETITGMDVAVGEDISTFSWSQREEARGAIADWLRDNTSAPAPVKAPQKTPKR